MRKVLIPVAVIVLVILEQGRPAQIFSTPAEPRTRQFLDRIIEAGRL